MGYEIIMMLCAGAAVGLLAFYMGKGILDILTGKMR